jgi:hypothetical protein
MEKSKDEKIDMYFTKSVELENNIDKLICDNKNHLSGQKTEYENKIADVTKTFTTYIGEYERLSKENYVLLESKIAE